VRLPGLGKAARNATTAALPSVAGSVAPGSALAGLFGTMVGGPGMGLASAGLDFAVSYPLTKLARVISPPKQSTTSFVKNAAGQLVPALEPSKLEGAANIGGMLLSSQLGGALIPYTPEPTVNSQDQTIMHEMMQRQMVNGLEVPQAVAPGTQFQMAGLEFLNNYTRPQQTSISLPVPERVQRLLQQTGMELGL
jgi:hypothetical protein